MGKKLEGVRPRYGKIQIYFKEKGNKNYTYETLDLTDTPVNLAKAKAMRDEIVEKIKYDVYDREKYFPKSNKQVILEQADSKNTFYYWAQKWLKLPTHDWKTNTRKKYLGVLQNYWMTEFHDIPINQIDFDDILDAIENTGLAEKSASYYNDSLTTIRGVFQLAKKSRRSSLTEDPTEELENKTRKRMPPDPLTIQEANKVISYAYDKYGVIWGAWFQVGFYLGLRCPGEMLGLKWTDIDHQQGTIRIQRQRLSNGQIQIPKTSNVREPKFNSIVRSAFTKLMPVTFGKEGDFIFRYESGEPVLTGKTPRRFWKEALRELGIRERRMYDMRHTYASYALMNGLNPSYVAKSLGHSAEEFFRTYAKWIETEMSELQMRLIEEAIERDSKTILAA